MLDFRFIYSFFFWYTCRSPGDEKVVEVKLLMNGTNRWLRRSDLYGVLAQKFKLGFVLVVIICLGPC